MDKAVEAAYVQNAWFTLANIHSAFRNWSDVLRRETMMNWLSVYPDPEWNNQTVGLVLAGNLPLVGFHDVICVLLSGQKAAIKLSSKDKILIPALINILQSKFPEIKEKYGLLVTNLGRLTKLLRQGATTVVVIFRITSKTFHTSFEKIGTV